MAAGVYNLTVDGTGTAGNRSTPLTLTVSAAPDYALSLNPAALTIVQGANATSTVTLTRSNFAGAVTLSLGGAPAGVTGSFNPAAPTGTSSTLTVDVGAAVAPGVYNLTVDGTGTAGNRSTPLTLTVSAAPDYALSLTPAALTIVQGANGTTAVTLTRTNFTGAVTLSLGGAPAGVTGSFNPAAPTGNGSTLTVDVGAAVAPGVYNLTVDGTGTPGNRSTPLTLTVSAAPADYALSLNPAALSIVQSTTGNTTVTLTRTNFTGAVTLSLGGAPAGVTGSFSPAAPTGTSSTLTVDVGAAVTPGVYDLTVDGTGTPGNRSTQLTLTVTAAPADYVLSLNPAALSIAQSANGNTTVTLTRTNFTGAVTLSLGGAPAGVTGSFNPAAPTGTSSTLTVSVGASVTPGVYNLTVDGTGTPGNRSTPLTLTVTASGGGNVTWNFSACGSTLQPVWLAYQDGTGPWTVVTPVNNVYTFTITTRGGITYVLAPTGTNSTVLVQYFTKAELGTGTVFCPTPGVLKTVNGTVAGVGNTEAAHVSLGGGSAFVTAFSTGFPNFQITSVANGTQDLVASHRPSFTGIADKAIIRRGLNIPDNGSVGATLDFGGVEAFSLNTATITVTGLTGTETSLSQGMNYQVAGCEGGPLYSSVPWTGSSFTAAGVPAAQQVASDYHGISLFAHDAASGETRSTTQYFQTFGASTVALPSVFPTPTVTSLGGPYKRLQAVYTLPTDYQQSTSLNYNDQVSTGRAVSMTATFAYLGSTAVTFALADYSALAGWDNNWAPASANTADWTVSGSGGNATSGLCAAGTRVDYGSVNGSN